MKKFLTLALALVLALALTVPAMAFTSSAPSEDVPYELDIYLVEYDDNDFFGIASLPQSDRGYAKNEVVAAIVEVFVPEDEALASDYTALILSGDNVKLNVTDNGVSGTTAKLRSTEPNATDGKTTFAYDSDDDELSLSLSGKTWMVSNSKDVTSKFLFFAKVTGDDASLTATLDDATDDRFSDSASVSSIVIEIDDVDYTVVLDKDAKTYTVSDTAGELFTIVYGDKNKSKDLFIEDYLVGVNADRESLTFTKGTETLTSGSTYKALLKIYNDVFVDAFGFDFFARGGVVNNDTFYGISGNEDIEATVEIKPWTAYVTVPDNIVVDPPKTGDAASIVGFVMIVLAAAAVVAVKKVRA